MGIGITASEYQGISKVLAALEAEFLELVTSNNYQTTAAATQFAELYEAAVQHAKGRTILSTDFKRGLSVAKLGFDKAIRGSHSIEKDDLTVLDMLGILVHNTANVAYAPKTQDHKMPLLREIGAEAEGDTLLKAYIESEKAELKKFLGRSAA